MKLPKIKIPFLKYATGVISGLLIAFLVLPLIGGESIYSEFEKFQYVFGLVVKEYFEDVDITKLNEGAIRGMLKDLDPHSVYMTPKEMKAASEEMSGSFDGIGVSFQVPNDTLVIETVIPGGPSEKMGIMPRDRIVNVNGESIIGLERDSIPKLLKGPKGTTVNLDIYRPSSRKLLQFAVVRDKIPMNTVDASFMVDGTDIGYIKISRFAQTTTKEMLEASNQLKKKV